MRDSLMFFVYLFVGLFIYTKVVGPIPFSVNSIQTTKTNLFSATGTAKQTAIPNTAELSLGVTKTAKTISDAQNSTNSVMNKLTADLKNLGIAETDIKTTNYSVNPNYDYTNARQTINGYTVSQNLDVKTKQIEKANQAIDTATADGANIVGGVNFILDDQTQKDLEDKARKEAVANAKEKAESLANAAGIKLGRIVDVQESGTTPQPMFDRALMVGGGEADQKTSLTPGENTIETTVTLSYETY